MTMSTSAQIACNSKKKIDNMEDLKRELNNRKNSFCRVLKLLILFVVLQKRKLNLNILLIYKIEFVNIKMSNTPY